MSVVGSNRLVSMSNMLLTGRKVLVPVMIAGSKLLISASMPMISVSGVDCARTERDGAANAFRRGSTREGVAASAAAAAPCLSKRRRESDSMLRDLCSSILEAPCSLSRVSRPGISGGDDFVSALALHIIHAAIHVASGARRWENDGRSGRATAGWKNRRRAGA